MKASITLGCGALCILGAAMVAAPCFAQAYGSYGGPYGNGPQYSTPAEQAQTRQLNEQAIDGTTQSPAELNGEAAQSPPYARQPYEQGNPQTENGYAGEPSSSYPDQSMRDYDGPPSNASSDYNMRPQRAYGDPRSLTPYASAPDTSAAPPYGQPEYGQPESYEGREPSRDQLRYEDQMARYRQQQAQYRRDQEQYRGSVEDYDRAMDEWYNAPPVEEYP